MFPPELPNEGTNTDFSLAGRHGGTFSEHLPCGLQIPSLDKVGDTKKPRGIKEDEKDRKKTPIVVLKMI